MSISTTVNATSHSNSIEVGEDTQKFLSLSGGATPVHTNSNPPANTPNITCQSNVGLEDGIQAVVAKKRQELKTQAPPNLYTTIASNYTTEDDTRIVKTQTGTMTLAEYRKRNPFSLKTVTLRTAIRSQKTQLPVAGQLSTVPIARVHPYNRIESSPTTEAEPTVSESSSNAPIQISSSVYKTSHNNYEIQTCHILQNRSQQVNQTYKDKDLNSAKMLIILASGEQRLVTFTLPRESCTVQDLLEKVGVPFDNKTIIQCIENPGGNINFVVTVGFNVEETASELISRAEESMQLTNPSHEASVVVSQPHSSQTATTGNTKKASGTRSTPIPITSTTSNMQTPAANLASGDEEIDSTLTSSKAPEEVPRKIIQGLYAVCQSC